LTDEERSKFNEKSKKEFESGHYNDRFGITSLVAYPEYTKDLQKKASLNVPGHIYDQTPVLKRKGLALDHQVKKTAGPVIKNDKPGPWTYELTEGHGLVSVSNAFLTKRFS